MAFRHREHTADLALEVEAATLEELFGEALRGFTDCVTEVDRLRPVVHRRLEASAPALDLLLAECLQEALFRFEERGELYCEAVVTVGSSASGHRLAAEVRGERLDPGRHSVKVAIKAVTLHELAVERRRDGWWARVVLDI